MDQAEGMSARAFGTSEAISQPKGVNQGVLTANVRMTVCKRSATQILDFMDRH